jgi:septum formation topological specificity factor MinE
MTSCSDYYKFILDDSDGDEDDEGICGHLDTQWITEYENQFLLSEYEQFLKTDIIRVSFQFVYLDRDKMSVEFVVPMTESYVLHRANQITQNELLQIIHKYQNHSSKKYYNFHSLLLYDFQIPENNGGDNRWLSQYLAPSVAEMEVGSEVDDCGYGRIIEYKNILSFDTIYFRPLIAMFHDLIGFTVILYED